MGEISCTCQDYWPNGVPRTVVVRRNGIKTTKTYDEQGALVSEDPLQPYPKP